MAMAKNRTRYFFAWTDIEVKLFLKVTQEYKATVAAENRLGVAAKHANDMHSVQNIFIKIPKQKHCVFALHDL